MFFRKRPTFNDPILGTLTFWMNRWNVQLEGDATIFVAIQGDRAGPDPVALAEAKSLLQRQSEWAEAALAFARADPHAIAFAKGQGDLSYEGITTTREPGSFTVELGLSQWPDAMLDVEFTEYRPQRVLLSD